jgi:hypothetical protein
MMMFSLRRLTLATPRPVCPLAEPEDAAFKVELALFCAGDHAVEIRTRTRSEAGVRLRRNDRDGNGGAVSTECRTGSAPERF